MGRPKQEINPIRGQRLEKLIDILGIKQCDLAKMIPISQQTISGIVKGNKNLTENVASRIAELFPNDCRFQWLMGFDQYRTEDDEIAANIEQSQRSGVMEQEFMKKISRGAGYTLSYAGMSLMEVARGGENYILTDNNGKEFRFGFKEYQYIWTDIFDYAAFRLKRTIEKKYNRIQFKIDFGDDDSKGESSNG